MGKIMVDPIAAWANQYSTDVVLLSSSLSWPCSRDCRRLHLLGSEAVVGTLLAMTSVDVDALSSGCALLDRTHIAMRRYASELLHFAIASFQES